MKLYYFTNSFPFGLGEEWKINELNELINHFEEITVVPLHYDNNFDNPKQLPIKINLVPPLFRSISMIITKRELVKIFSSRYAFQFIAELFRQKAFLNKQHLIHWAMTCLRIMKTLKHPVIKKIIKEGDNKTCLYFFWGRGTADIVPLISLKKYRKVLIRLHRFDLYEYENNGYIPFRSQLVRKKEVVLAPCSNSGIVYLKSVYPKHSCQLRLLRLGTKDFDRVCNPGNDGVLRIVSCSMLSAVKRVHLMIECLAHIQVKFEWYHIGDGELMGELTTILKNVPHQGHFQFVGRIPSNDIKKFYIEKQPDLFINVSSSEGVPVSIMEAFSVGLPVMATDVGGTAEIVDEEVGSLLPANISPVQLAKKIDDFYQLPPDARYKKRDAAYKRFLERCNTEKLTKVLVNELINNN